MIVYLIWSERPGSQNTKKGESWSAVSANFSPLPLSHWTVRSGSGSGMSSSWSFTLTFTFLAVVGAAGKGSAAGRASGGNGGCATCKCHTVCCSVSDPYSTRSVDPDSNLAPDPGGQKWPTKVEKNWEISCFEVLDILFWELKASP